MNRRRLVADIGGTNLRIACAAAGVLGEVAQAPLTDYASFTEALRQFVARLPGDGAPAEAAVAAAGPLDGDEIHLTNAPWTIRAGEISAEIGGGSVKLFNDLEAVALALPHLDEAAMRPIGGPRAPARAGRLIAVNVGTGCGAASVALSPSGVWRAQPSEPGHMTLGAASPAEEALWRRLSSRTPTVEDILSGRGLRKLYATLGDGSAVDTEDAAAHLIFDRAASDATALTTLEVFTAVLGRIAGDLVLATASWGGVFLCGGLMPGWLRVADPERFRAAFEAKGPMRDRMARVPTSVLMRENVALLGLAHAPLD